jgi:prephenate dehydratase
VLRQCRRTLSEKYPRLRLTSGDGELIDHALVAERLGRGELPRSVATMASRLLAEIHGLQVIEDDLQDAAENFTAFLWVQRPSARAADLATSSAGTALRQPKTWRRCGAASPSPFS